MVTEVNPTEIAPEPVLAAEQDVIFRGGAPLAFVGDGIETVLLGYDVHRAPGRRSGPSMIDFATTKRRRQLG